MDRSAPRTLAFAVCGPIARASLVALGERIEALLELCDGDVVLCDVGDLAADAVTVDALARIQVAAGRHGAQLRLRRASRELRELLDVMGLGEVLPD
ncbi:MAG: STAS domain-containing protein [Solirubrobacteraceae bacterium]